MNEQKPPNAIEWWETWTPDLAYTLGLIFADGSVRDNHHDVAIVQKDPTILQILLPIVQGENKRIVPSGRNGNALKLRVKGLRHILANYGIVPRKTYLGTYPKSIPPHLVTHYIRGFFDGDGYILEKTQRHKRRGWIFGFTCHINHYLEWVVSSLVDRGMPKATIYLSNKDWKTKWHTYEALKIMSELLYGSEGIYLPRKRHKFDEALQYHAETPPYSGKHRPSAKLTEVQVREIRALYATGKYSYVRLANEFGIGKTTVESIVKCETWRNV